MYEDAKCTSRVLRTYVSIRSSYSSIRSSYPDALRFLCVHLKNRSTYVTGPICRTCNRDVCTAYLSYLLRMCGVSSILVSYLRRISDIRVAYLAYQWRMCYVCATYVSLLWSMCDVLGVLGIFVVFRENLNASI